jgi:hypothetical protein
MQCYLILEYGARVNGVQPAPKGHCGRRAVTAGPSRRLWIRATACLSERRTCRRASTWNFLAGLHAIPSMAMTSGVSNRITFSRFANATAMSDACCGLTPVSSAMSAAARRRTAFSTYRTSRRVIGFLGWTSGPRLGNRILQTLQRSCRRFTVNRTASREWVCPGHLGSSNDLDRDALRDDDRRCSRIIAYNQRGVWERCGERREDMVANMALYQDLNVLRLDAP